MPQISVIVPVFQAEKNLHRCIDSILAQTYSDFELILVDDGSLDNSGKICDDFASKDDRVFVVHKQNAGVSAARNTGLELAQGLYIAFVDSDDYVDARYLEKLIHAEADLAICGSYIISESHEKSIYLHTSKSDCEVTPNTIADWFDKEYLKYVWGKLFCREIIINYALRFDSRISLGEDTVFAVQYALRCKHLAAIPDNLYYYVKYPSGTLTKQLTPNIVISNDMRDSMLDTIFKESGIVSKTFYTAQYVSKQKMKHAFLSIFESTDMNIFEKYRWYRLFFELPLYTNNMDILTDGFSGPLRWIINKKSAALLILFHVVAKAKRMIESLC
jgi:glycosyltransferase involved in cell wall biosynthesis